MDYPVNIGEAAKMSGISMKMIRHYEAISLLDSPNRTASGYRTYSEAHIHMLRFIRQARTLGFALEEIKTLLSLWQNKQRSSRDVKHMVSGHIDVLDRKIQALETMRQTLAQLVDCCHGDDRPDCPILDSLATTSSQ